MVRFSLFLCFCSMHNTIYSRVEKARTSKYAHPFLSSALSLSLSLSSGGAGSLLRRGQIDLVLYGADRVAANGDVVNKIGTVN